MKNLQLSLIKKWFDMTKTREKTEDYRNITPYWCNRLLLFAGAPKPVKEWEYYLNLGYTDHCDNINNIREVSTFKRFTQNTMTLGYTKKGDAERILKLEHKGIEIRTGRPEWGAEEGKLYFVIKHGLEL